MDARRLLIFLFAVGLVPTVSALSVYDDLHINQSETLDGKWYNITDGSADGAIIMNCTGCTLDCNGTTINGSNAGIGIHTDSEDYFTIANCTIINYDTGVYFIASTHSVLRNSTIDVDDYAFQLRSTSSYNNITNNTMTAAQLLLTGGGAGQYNNFSRNTMLATGSGTAFYYDSNNYVYHNEIRKTADIANYVLPCHSGVKIVGNNLTHDDGVIISTVGTGCLIYNNNLTSPFSKGIFYSSAATGVNISYNYFDVKNDGIEVDYWYDSYIHDNHIKGQGVNGIALFIGTHDLQIYNNTIVMSGGGDGFHWRQCWDITAWDNKIMTSGQAVDFYDCENSTISNSSFGAGKIYAHDDATNNTLLNVTYTGAETVSDTSWFYRKWYAKVYTNYTDGSAASGADVYGYNTSNKLVDNGTTDVSGYVTLELIQYKNDSGTTRNYVNYTVNATDGTNAGRLTDVTLSTNRNLNLTLEEPPKVHWNWTFINTTYLPYAYGPGIGDIYDICVNASKAVNCSISWNGTRWANSTTSTDICFFNQTVPDGNYTDIYVACEDSVGNTGQTTTGWVNVDSIAPLVVNTFPMATRLYHSFNTTNTTINFQANVSEYGSHVDNCSFWIENTSFYGAANNSCDLSITGAGTWFAECMYSFPGSDYREINWSIRCDDNATNEFNSSNQGQSTYRGNLSIDNTGPSINITSPSNGSTISGQSVTLQISHTESHPDTLTLNFDGTNTTYSYSGSTSSITRSGLAWNSNHWFIVYANDTVGNSNRTGTYSFHVPIDMGGAGGSSTSLLLQQVGGIKISAIAPPGGLQTTRETFTLAEIGGDLVLENRGEFVLRPEVQLGAYADLLPPIFPGETYSLRDVELFCNQPTCAHTLLLIVNGMRDTFTFETIRIDLTRTPIQYSSGFSPLSIFDNGGLVDLTIIIAISIIAIALLWVFLRRR